MAIVDLDRRNVGCSRVSLGEGAKGRCRMLDVESVADPRRLVRAKRAVEEVTWGNILQDTYEKEE